jgi:FkbM family methyltransferase
MLSPYLIENRHIAVKWCRHGLFMYNRNDAFVGRSLDLYGEWCDFEIRILRPFINAGDIVIDAGANIGTHTIAFAHLVGGSGTVHAFEPARRHFQMLAGNVALNGLDNVVCHQKAIGASNGEIRVPPLPAADITYNYSAVTLTEDSAGEVVPLVTLDSLNLPACRVIKIDTEGMETKAIAGAQALISRYRPLIYVENNEPGASKRLSAALDAIDYRAWWSIFPYFDIQNFYSNTNDIWSNYAPSANMLCAPKEVRLEISLDPFFGPNDDWKASINRAGIKEAHWSIKHMSR